MRISRMLGCFLGCRAPRSLREPWVTGRWEFSVIVFSILLATPQEGRRTARHPSPSGSRRDRVTPTADNWVYGDRDTDVSPTERGGAPSAGLLVVSPTIW